MQSFKQYAIIGPTASGKTALAIALAQKENAYILSLDSLAIYKEIDIVSAKPTPQERNGIEHFGIDCLYPNEAFDVTTFIALYQNAKSAAVAAAKNLVIVGGTSFYLKMLLEGISPRPTLSQEQQQEVARQMQDPNRVYRELLAIDSDYMQQIQPGDRYRTQKALEVLVATKTPAGVYFAANPPQPIITESLPIYEIVWDRTTLRERIRLRTEKMVSDGLIDEIITLEKKYTRAPHCMKAIGIKETLIYLDGYYNKAQLIEKIAINTGRLAKRQETFNRSQFKDVIRGDLKELKQRLLS